MHKLVLNSYLDRVREKLYAQQHFVGDAISRQGGSGHVSTTPPGGLETGEGTGFVLGA